MTALRQRARRSVIAGLDGHRARTLCLSLGLAVIGGADLPGQAEGIEFRNGLWYSGSGFEPRTFYAVDGVLTATPPAAVARRVDLAGGYVIPPFGEAHNHVPDGWPGSSQRVARFIEQGIFYVMNPNSFSSMTKGIEAELNKPASIDVLFANGGLTPSGSHVTELYERNLRRGVFPDGWTLERLDGEGYLIVDDRGDLDRKWPMVPAGRPDFVKVFLAFSEEYGERRDNPAFIGRRGVDPQLVPEIVERAHAAGLRVAVHIETAQDFRVAVGAGADIIAHMPASWRIGAAAGYADSTIDRWLLRDEDAAAAARRDVVVVAHVFNGRSSPVIARIHAHNLALLKRHGVRLAIGSDNIRQSSLREAIYLQSTGLFTPAEVLRIASVTTPTAIFPTRKIGRLEEGYEASFLVIAADPIARPLFATMATDVTDSMRQVVGRIRLRVKQGHVFNGPFSAGPGLSR